MKCKFHANWCKWLVCTASSRVSHFPSLWGIWAILIFTWRSWTNPFMIQACGWSQQHEEWKINWHLNAPTKFGWHLVWEHQYMDFVQRSLFNKQPQTAQTGLARPSLPSLLSLVLPGPSCSSVERKKKFPNPCHKEQSQIYIYAQKYVNIFNLTSVFLWLADAEHCFSLRRPSFLTSRQLCGDSWAKRNK